MLSLTKGSVNSSPIPFALLITLLFYVLIFFKQKHNNIIRKMKRTLAQLLISIKLVKAKLTGSGLAKVKCLSIMSSKFVFV